MKIYRAIGEKEKHSLLENNSILYPHQTCLKEEWVLTPHPEDYGTGKFFFFTMEDALLYARERFILFKKDAYILEMDIEEKYVLPYIGYGLYSYPDYQENGNWNGNCCHEIPELLLPYGAIEKNLQKNKYTLHEFDRNDYFCYGEEDVYKFKMPKQADRAKSFVNMGRVLSKIKKSECNIDYFTRCLKSQEGDCHKSENGRDYYKEDLKKEQEKNEKYKALFPQAFKNFMADLKDYVWQDFRNPDSSGTTAPLS